MSPGGGPGPSLGALDLDKVIHERSRLMILTFLASSAAGEAGFTELKETLGFTAGNLSVQLKTLEEVGYLRIEKRFVANRSYTGVSLTEAGEKALSDYLAELEVIVASLRAGVKNESGRADAAGTLPGAAIGGTQDEGR